MSIWQYSEKYKYKISEQYRLSLGEGETDLSSLQFEDNAIFIKQENQNPNGSHKDRSLAYQLSYYRSIGKSKFSLSSSGNAGISAIAYCSLFDCELNLFLSKNIPKEKLKRVLLCMEKYGGKQSLLENNEKKDIKQQIGQATVKIFFSDNAVKDSVKHSYQNGTVLLRGSTDDAALEGFKSISFEIVKQLPSCTDIFIPCSSGTTFYGVYLGYKFILENDSTGNSAFPRLHLVQTTSVNKIASYVIDLNKNTPSSTKLFKNEKKSLASAIVDRTGFRKNQALEAISASKGSALVVEEGNIEKMTEFLREKGYNCSYESGLVLAGYKKTLDSGLQMDNPAILMTGVE